VTDLPAPGSRPTHDCDLVKEGPALTCPAGLPVPRGTVLTRGALRSVAVLVLLALLVTGANLLWTAHVVNSSRSSQQQEQQAQRGQGELVERKLCTTLGRLAALKPPPGSASANPSRAYEQETHATLAQLGPDLGCK
jgi:hypothetical protein